LPCSRRREQNRLGSRQSRVDPFADNRPFSAFGDGDTQAAVARTYGVSQATISRLEPRPFVESGVDNRAAPAGLSLQRLVGWKAAAGLVVKRSRWREDGVWPRILEAGTLVMRRFSRRQYGESNEPMARVMRHLTVEARRA
jgi:hypothetical protein